MKVLEAAIGAKRLISLIDEVESVDGFIVCFHYHYNGVRFSVWENGSDHQSSPMFNAKLELIKDNGYTGDIEQAREALKQYLEKDV